MSKGAKAAAAGSDFSNFCKSTFTLTFAVEILGIDVWHDCNEGWLDLGQYVQSMKIQYQLYPGHTYDLDILIWPHAAKIWCGGQYGWVRTWQFLERRWLAFSIRHAFPVRVVDLQKHVATVTPSVGTGSLGANAKNDKNFEVFLPALGFGDRRYFAQVLEGQETELNFVQNLIWHAVVEYIPASYLDGLFDVPYAVSDVRHQDASLYHVREAILSRSSLMVEEEEEPINYEIKPRIRRESKSPKEKEKKKIAEAVKMKFEIKLTGDTILSGTGRIVPFETVGDRSADLGGIITLISTDNLPAQDDFPIVFVNVESLCEIPANELKLLRITQLYTRWEMAGEVHKSEAQPIRSNKREIAFNDHHAIPIPYELVTKVMADFVDDYYEIQLRGIRLPPQSAKPILFGYKKGDRDFDSPISKPSNTDLDILIAITRIHTGKLAKGMNVFLKGDYPLYPPITSFERKDELLTGFAIDTGEVAVLFVEGPKDGHILHVWDMTEDFYPIVKPLFSCSVHYSSRIYPELLVAATPFSVLKMFVPLGVLLACPPIYARPALPLPTRSAVLKIGRLTASKLQFAPSRSEMPTGGELKSFRLELCVAPRPIPVFITDNPTNKTEHAQEPRTSIQSVSRINWDKA